MYRSIGYLWETPKDIKVPKRHYSEVYASDIFYVF